MSLWDGPQTVGQFIKALSEFPPDWPVKVATPAGPRRWLRLATGLDSSERLAASAEISEKI
jgi:hypothetical protein